MKNVDAVVDYKKEEQMLDYLWQDPSLWGEDTDTFVFTAGIPVNPFTLDTLTWNNQADWDCIHPTYFTKYMSVNCLHLDDWVYNDIDLGDLNSCFSTVNEIRAAMLEVGIPDIYIDEMSSLDDMQQFFTGAMVTANGASYFCPAGEDGTGNGICQSVCSCEWGYEWELEGGCQGIGQWPEFNIDMDTATDTCCDGFINLGYGQTNTGGWTALGLGFDNPIDASFPYFGLSPEKVNVCTGCAVGASEPGGDGDLPDICQCCPPCFGNGPHACPEANEACFYYDLLDSYDRDKICGNGSGNWSNYPDFINYIPGIDGATSAVCPSVGTGGTVMEKISSFPGGQWIYNSGAPGTVYYNFDCDTQVWPCCPPAPGCTDPEASNYQPDATEDDGSCLYGNEFAEACIDMAPYGQIENPTNSGMSEETFATCCYEFYQLGPVGGNNSPVNAVYWSGLDYGGTPQLGDWDVFPTNDTQNYAAPGLSSNQETICDACAAGTLGNILNTWYDSPQTNDWICQCCPECWGTGANACDICGPNGILFGEMNQIQNDGWVSDSNPGGWSQGMYMWCTGETSQNQDQAFGNSDGGGNTGACFGEDPGVMTTIYTSAYGNFYDGGGTGYAVGGGVDMQCQQIQACCDESGFWDDSVSSHNDNLARSTAKGFISTP